MDVEKCFEILGISSHSSMDEVKQAYRDLVNVWHPDRFTHNDRLRKKAEEELKKINLAYTEIQQLFSFDSERQRLKVEEEERLRREAEIRAKAKAEEQMRQEAKAKHYAHDDWESRTLCGDGRCIGIIGNNGRCKECGKTLEEARNEEKDKSYLKKEKPNQPKNATSSYSRQDNTSYDDPIDWDNRVLCSDEACIGIIGSDGRCTKCRRHLR